jgi:DNA-binding IclR family transcriptional regulator
VRNIFTQRSKIDKPNYQPRSNQLHDVSTECQLTYPECGAKFHHVAKPDSALTNAEPAAVLVLAKAFAILDLFTRDNPTHDLAAIRQATGLPFSTCSRIAQSLVAGGLLTRSPKGYRVGATVLRLAGAAVEQNEPVDLIAPYVSELRDATGETSGFFVTDGANRVCVLVAEATHSLMRRLSIGHVLPLYVGSPGRVLLAYSSEARDAAKAESRKTFTDSTKTEWAEITLALAEVVRDGVAVSEGEWEAGLSGVAAPVFAANGVLIGAIGISAPTSRVTKSDLGRLRKLVRTAGHDASLRLGFLGSPD